MSIRRLSITILLTVVSLVGKLLAAEPVQFASQVQPIFAQKCLTCHGLDKGEGGLRLHNQAGALAELDSGEFAIVPGKPQASELLHRISTDDPDLRMPPEGDALTAGETATLRQWIAEGAPWQVHWAYRPLQNSKPPSVSDSTWPVNDIDRYILARLQSAKLTPSPAADRTTLMKRLHYDLVGLPPEPAEVDAFLQDKSPDAYEQLVERLLASAHFGERWGRHWLDKARFADSDGYEKDNDRPDAWRYRDWVIQSINDDLPFDQFTIEQLAGDMLPKATSQQRLATAFNRQTLTNTEGGTDQEQWRVAAVMDRTETLGAVWLGLTVGCARCHNHKYDQITQKEYYQLFAYFNNGDEVSASVPRTIARNPSQRAAAQQLRQQLAERKRQLSKNVDAWLPALKVEAAASEETKYHLFKDVKVKGPKGVTFTQLDDGSFLVGGANVETATYTIEGKVTAANVTGLRLEVFADSSLPAGGPGRVRHGNFVLNEIRLFTAAQPQWSAENQRRFTAATADFSQDNWPGANAIDGIEGPMQQGTGWAISPQFNKNHHAIFALDRPLPKHQQHWQVVLSQTYGSQHTIGRFRVMAVTGKVAGGGMPDDVRQLLTVKTVDEQTTERIVEYYQRRDPASVQLQGELDKLSRLTGEMMNVRVIGQRVSNPRPTHIFRRGEFKQPLDEVQPGTLATLPPINLPEGQTSSTRLDMARWLVADENPLVPRVAVNHIWKYLFGQGIVPTMNDFGVRGDPPSHPALLDHLAHQLIANDWSRKAVIKQIVMSATYRQSSHHRPELLQHDPKNQLLHRQNRFRVEAEIIRDATLAASGLLSRKIGGPSVFPPIPKSVTALTYNSSFKWKTSTGEDRYRRGMYTYFKRTAPHPNLITFDCPDSNVANVDRDRSNTPIAALVTLNNETFVEAAQAFAQHVLSRDNLSTDHARLAYALRRCIARVPSDAEVADFEQLLNTSRQWYQTNEDAAKQLVGSRRADSVTMADNAAWVATLRMVLNLDEFITRE